MPANPVPLAKLSPMYREKQQARASGRNVALRRIALWCGGLLVAAALYWGVPAFWQWPHVISSSGGRYFWHRVVIPVPVFTQDDPRWCYDQLGPSDESIGQAGCAITSAAMVLAAYGVDTDPQRLNQYLIANEGYTPNGWLYWEKAAAIAPYGQVEKAYEDPPSYALIDRNLLAGNPVIVRLTLRNGTMHFVVINGKDGWDYLIQDPAHIRSTGVYPLRELTDHIEALRFYWVVAPTIPPVPPPAPTPPVVSEPPTIP